MNPDVEHSVVGGEGILLTTAGQHSVKYHFDVQQAVTKQEGIVLGRGRRSTAGQVTSLTGASIPNGTWKLTLSTGEVWKVLNENGEWNRLAD